MACFSGLQGDQAVPKLKRQPQAWLPSIPGGMNVRSADQAPGRAYF